MFLKLQPHIKCVIYELHKKLYRIDENWKGVLHVLELSCWQNSIKFWADSHVRWSNSVPHMAVSLRGFYWTVVLLVRNLCVISKAWSRRTIERLLILSFGINFLPYLAHIPFSLYLKLQQLVSSNSVAWTWPVSDPYLIGDLWFCWLLNVYAFVGSAKNEHMMGMFFKNVAEFKYLGMTLANQNCIPGEIRE